MKKIMFSDRYGLTDAVLSGRKTMTRRIVLPIEVDWNGRGRMTLPVSGFMHGLLWMDCSEFLPGSGLFDYVAPQKYQPRYGKGEVVAVAQSYKDCWDIYQRRWKAKKSPSDWHTPDAILGDQADTVKGWSNKMFVRADLMPHHISITDLLFERLQDISDEDCLKEGVEKWMDCYIVSGIMERGGKSNVCFDTPREAFAALIDRISGRGTWKSNPWVVAYEFELIRKEG